VPRAPDELRTRGPPAVTDVPDDESAAEVSEAWFADPPLRYRPSATVRVGDGSVDEVPVSLQTAVDEGFGSLMLYPAATPPGSASTDSRDPTLQRVRRSVDPEKVRTWLAEIGTDPTPRPAGPPAEYLSEEYFRRYSAALDVARAHGMTAILYDELDYPSGYAGGGRVPPEHFRKLLTRTRIDPLPRSAVMPPGQLVAAVGVHDSSRQRLDLTPLVTDGILRWEPPSAGWTLQVFCLVTSEPQGGKQDYHAVVDYFDPVAVQQFIDLTYEAYAQHVGDHLGSTITTKFFDDVGIYSAERTWSARIGERFRERTGRDPATYYPALWEDIGPETVPARVAFFAARAELLGEGFPALVTEWARRHGLSSSGHCPGQYEVQPTDMNGDPFIFYRAQDIPMIDVIYTYGFGREGFKLTSSAADALDKPVVLAEQFTTRGTAMGYRRSMDSFVRGVNWIIGRTGNEIGPPSTFAEWAGRLSMLLQGGRRVADIAVLYPIASLQAHYRFEAPDNAEGPVGRYAPSSADYLSVGDRLTTELHRDFTFVHPADLTSDRFHIDQGVLVLDNPVNRQEFRVVILPGTDVISVTALQVLKDFQASGGAVIATTALPTHSAEFGRDDEVRRLVDELFRTAEFVPEPSSKALAAALTRLASSPDVAFAASPRPVRGGGHLAYIHKVKGGRDIVLVVNSSNERVSTTISIRGAMRLDQWDPHNGEIRPAPAEVVDAPAGPRTQCPIELPPVTSTVLVGTSGLC
jgi:hypothetical protein